MLREIISSDLWSWFMIFRSLNTISCVAKLYSNTSARWIKSPPLNLQFVKWKRFFLFQAFHSGKSASEWTPQFVGLTYRWSVGVSFWRTSIHVGQLEFLIPESSRAAAANPSLICGFKDDASVSAGQRRGLHIQVHLLVPSKGAAAGCWPHQVGEL